LEPDDIRLPNLLHTKKDSRNVIDWMKNDWNERANVDPMYFVRTQFNQTEKEFWSGQKQRDNKILGINTSRFAKITKGKVPKKMKALEIGCGIGRILVPMSEIFGEVIGIDISSKMVEIGQENTKDIPNCKVLQNNGKDLSMFSDNYFDFCYSIIVFHHIPDKKIIEEYFQEISRVLKTYSIFRFQIGFEINRNQLHVPDTWIGYRFDLKEIKDLASKNQFKILEQEEIGQQHWFTFHLMK